MSGISNARRWSALVDDCVVGSAVREIISWNYSVLRHVERSWVAVQVNARPQFKPLAMLGRPRGREQRKRHSATVSRRTARPQSTARNDKDANAAPHGAAKHATYALLERKRKYAQRECKYAKREPLALSSPRSHFGTVAPHGATSITWNKLHAAAIEERGARLVSRANGGNAHSRHTPMMTAHAQRGVT